MWDAIITGRAREQTAQGRGGVFLARSRAHVICMAENLKHTKPKWWWFFHNNLQMLGSRCGMRQWGLPRMGFFHMDIMPGKLGSLHQDNGAYGG